MIVGHVVDPVMRQHAMTGCEFDTGSPFLRTALFANWFCFGYEVDGHDAVPLLHDEFDAQYARYVKPERARGGLPRPANATVPARDCSACPANGSMRRDD